MSNQLKVVMAAALCLTILLGVLAVRAPEFARADGDAALTAQRASALAVNNTPAPDLVIQQSMSDTTLVLGLAILLLLGVVSLWFLRSVLKFR